MKTQIKDIVNLLQILQPRIEAGFRKWSQGGSAELLSLTAEFRCLHKILEECRLEVEIPKEAQEIMEKYSPKKEVKEEAIENDS